RHQLAACVTDGHRLAAFSWVVGYLASGTSHNLICPFVQPEARIFPSGLNATDRHSQTYPPLALNFPVLTFQSWTSPSQLPVARVLPSGLKATDMMSPDLATAGKETLSWRLARSQR